MFCYFLRVYTAVVFTFFWHRAVWSWSHGSWIYNYLCNQGLSPLALWVRIPLRQGVLDITLCDKVCQWLATGQWFSPGTPVSSTNKIDCHDITKILLKVPINTITLTLTPFWYISYNNLYASAIGWFPANNKRVPVVRYGLTTWYGTFPWPTTIYLWIWNPDVTTFIY